MRTFNKEDFAGMTLAEMRDYKNALLVFIAGQVKASENEVKVNKETLKLEAIEKYSGLQIGQKVTVSYADGSTKVLEITKTNPETHTVSGFVLDRNGNKMPSPRFEGKNWSDYRYVWQIVSVVD